MSLSKKRKHDSILSKSKLIEEWGRLGFPQFVSLWIRRMKWVKNMADEGDCPLWCCGQHKYPLKFWDNCHCEMSDDIWTVIRSYLVFDPENELVEGGVYDVKDFLGDWRISRIKSIHSLNTQDSKKIYEQYKQYKDVPPVENLTEVIVSFVHNTAHFDEIYILPYDVCYFAPLFTHTILHEAVLGANYQTGEWLENDPIDTFKLVKIDSTAPNLNLHFKSKYKGNEIIEPVEHFLHRYHYARDREICDVCA